MHQNVRLFNSCRVPGEKIDTLECHFKTGSLAVFQNTNSKVFILWCIQFHQHRRVFKSPLIFNEFLTNKLNNIFFYFVETEGKCPSHVVVISRGHFFVFDTLDDDGEQFTMPELQKQIEYIVDTCKDRPYGPGIGALTSLDRTLWAQVSV